MMDFSLLDPKEVTPCSFYWDRYHGSAAPLQHPASNYEHAIAPSPYCKDGHHSDYIIMLPPQPGHILMLVLAGLSIGCHAIEIALWHPAPPTQHASLAKLLKSVASLV